MSPPTREELAAYDRRAACWRIVLIAYLLGALACFGGVYQDTIKMFPPVRPNIEGEAAILRCMTSMIGAALWPLWLSKVAWEPKRAEGLEAAP